MTQSTIPSLVPSLWQKRFTNRVEFPPITESNLTEADFLVIGGGFAGISSAFQLLRRFPESRIALVEASKIAGGASGRSGGQVLNWINGVSRSAPATAKTVFELTQLGMNDLRLLAATTDAENALAWDGSLELYRTTKRAEDARVEADRFATLDIPLRYLNREELAEYIEPRGIVGALFDPTAGQVDGPRLLTKAASWLSRSGVSIFENSPVLKLIPGQPAHIKFESKSFRAAHVVLATNAATPRLGILKSQLFPLHSFVISADAQSSDYWSSRGLKRPVSFCDDSDRISYGCLTRQGEVVFGGGSNSAYRYLFGNKMEFQADGADAFRSIENLFKSYFPRAEDVEFSQRWSGVLDLTFDRCCSFGTIAGWPNILYAVGFSGHGTVLATLAGRVLADICAGEEERWRGAPFFQRPLPWIPPEPFRWIGYQVYTKATGRSPRKS